MDKKIELKGNIKDIEEYFIDKNKDKYKGRLFNKEEKKKYYKLMVYIFGIVIIILFIGFMYDTYMNNKYYNEQECNQITNKYIQELKLPFYERVFNSLLPYIPLLCIGLALGWILHGVRFNIIG